MKPILVFLAPSALETLKSDFIALVSLKPEDEWRRFAPPLIFWFGFRCKCLEPFV